MAWVPIHGANGWQIVLIDNYQKCPRLPVLVL